MLKDLILENEKKIAAFDLDNYKLNKDYPVISAICALETTNEIQKCYFEEEDKSSAYNAMKLYALLQSLFVSVDSLYALSYSLTQSKNYININKNKKLRELKYIRNDVVGHPANRILHSSELAYCVLNASKIQKYSFNYFIFSSNGEEEKEVKLLELVEAYYEESNLFLEQLSLFSKKDLKEAGLLKILRTILNQYHMGKSYRLTLEEFKKAYTQIYPFSISKQHRVLWRIDLIFGLLSFETKDQDISLLIDYAIGIEFVKIYTLIANKNEQGVLEKKIPYLVSSFYRFLNKNANCIPLVQNICDIKNPLLFISLTKLMQVAQQKNCKGVIHYLELLLDLYKKDQDDLLYSLTLPLKSYQKIL